MSNKPTSVRLPDKIRTKVEELAEREHRSFSNAIEVALIRYFACESQKGGDRKPA